MADTYTHPGTVVITIDSKQPRSPDFLLTHFLTPVVSHANRSIAYSHTLNTNHILLVLKKPDMQIKQFEKILLTIDSHGEKGCCAATIIRETGIEPTTVRLFLKKHNSLLIKKPSQKYTINASSKHKGNINNIVSSQLRTQRLNKVFLTITTAVVIFSLGLSTRSIL